MNELVEKPEAEKSAKLRESDLEAIDRLAQANDTNNKHVISWMRETFERAPERVRAAAKARVDRLYPRSRIRRGRGNRKRLAA